MLRKAAMVPHKMKSLETDTERKVVKWAEARGVMHLKLNLQMRRGWPDRVFWLSGGRPVLMEFKRKGEVPRPLQRFIMARLKEKGYDVCWTWDAEEAIAYLAAKIEAA